LDKHGSYNELYLCKILILIDNIKSGALLVSKTNTKTELMSKLNSLIDHYGIEHTKKLIQDSIDKFGISPKYKDVV